jgi:hypothetical protein
MLKGFLYGMKTVPSSIFAECAERSGIVQMQIPGGIADIDRKEPTDV